MSASQYLNTCCSRGSLSSSRSEGCQHLHTSLLSPLQALQYCSTTLQQGNKWSVLSCGLEIGEIKTKMCSPSLLAAEIYLWYLCFSRILFESVIALRYRFWLDLTWMADEMWGQFYLVSDVAEQSDQLLSLDLPELYSQRNPGRPSGTTVEYWVLCFTQLLSLSAHAQEFLFQ